FFLEVQRNRTVPFWSHPFLKPLVPSDNVLLPGPLPSNTIQLQGPVDGADGSDDEGDDEELNVIVEERRTFKERLNTRIEQLRDFCDGLEYQQQFGDSRFLDTLDREGAGLFRLIETCKSREQRANSRRSEAPTTWEKGSANAMFYRTRPSLADRDS
ncbi:hypothetical protein R3P38DRAFT_2461286, partial [Favolaschia claudopus]